jgi:hypothetical protein
MAETRIGDAPRYARGAKSCDSTPSRTLGKKISSYPAILGLGLLFSFGRFDIALVLVCTYQLRVRLLLCYQSHHVKQSQGHYYGTLPKPGSSYCPKVVFVVKTH